VTPQRKAWWLPGDDHTLRRFRPPTQNIIRSAYAEDVDMRPGLARAATGGHGSGRVLAGHFATFNKWAKIADRSGPFLERIMPGSFSRTFAQNRDQIRCLFQHGEDPQIGDKVLGPITVLREDDVGAYYEVPLLDTSYNRDLIPGLASGLYGASFRFSVRHQRVTDWPPRSAFNPDRLPQREILDARVRELGPVTFPAYSSATAGIGQSAEPALVAASSHPRRALYGSPRYLDARTETALVLAAQLHATRRS
jgi:HK97 family phage prohead protease